MVSAIHLKKANDSVSLKTECDESVLLEALDNLSNTGDVDDFMRDLTQEIVRVIEKRSNRENKI